MACITRQKIGKYTYLYESVSYRDKEGRPRNHKKRIGKIDPVTGNTVYDKEYLDRMEKQGTPIIVQNEAPTIIDDKVKNLIRKGMDTLKDNCTFHFLKSIAVQIGLLDILQESIENHWQEVFTLACYLICSDKPLMYLSDWISQTETLSVGNMSSQRISELLVSFQIEQRNHFYELWCKHITEQEYLALDITSISSYSELIKDCEMGYNRDHENLPQINLCMLMGEKSKLPVYQSIYSGSLKDVTTLTSIIKEISALVPQKIIRLVMDKGFFSTKNVNDLINENIYEFLIAVPFTSKFALKQVESESKDIDTPSKTLLTDDNPIRGIHKLRVFGNNSVKVHSHIFFNPIKASKEKNELYGYIAELKQLATINPDNPKLKSEFNKYLIVRKSNKSENGYTISIRDDVIKEKIKTKGWMVLLSNHIDNPQEAHDIYRAKDVVEKGFDKLKNSLNLGRLRVHTDERMQNKIFIGFIALIMMSHIHKVMKDKKLYAKFTMDKLLIVLAKNKVMYVNGERILRPLTKEQKTILESFNIKLSSVG